MRAVTREELWLQERPRFERQLRRVLSRADAQDVMDESFARLKGDDVYPGQLALTVQNVLREHARALDRQRDTEEQATILSGRAIPTIETAILRADFDRAFRGLPRPQQEAFALVELRGLTYQEAADVLGLPMSTVHWRCEAARSRLKEDLT